MRSLSYAMAHGMLLKDQAAQATVTTVNNLASFERALKNTADNDVVILVGHSHFREGLVLSNNPFRKNRILDQARIRRIDPGVRSGLIKGGVTVIVTCFGHSFADALYHHVFPDASHVYAPMNYMNALSLNKDADGKIEAGYFVTKSRLVFEFLSAAAFVMAIPLSWFLLPGFAFLITVAVSVPALLFALQLDNHLASLNIRWTDLHKLPVVIPVGRYDAVPPSRRLGASDSGRSKEDLSSPALSGVDASLWSSDIGAMSVARLDQVFDREALARLEAKGVVRALDEAGLDVLIGLGLIGREVRGLRGLYLVPTVDNNPYMEDSDGRLHNRSIHTSGPAPVYVFKGIGCNTRRPWDIFERSEENFVNGGLIASRADRQARRALELNAALTAARVILPQLPEDLFYTPVASWQPLYVAVNTQGYDRDFFAARGYQDL